MANTNAFCRALMVQMRDFPIDPSNKVTETGFLNMLLAQGKRTSVQEAYSGGTGHNRGSVIVSYQPRSVVGQVDDSLSCDVGITQVAKTTTFTPSLVSQIGLHISEADMNRYCEEASRTVLSGVTPAPPTPWMAEFTAFLYSQLNGLYQHIDTQLGTAMSTKWGANARTGSTAAATITLPLANTSQDLDAGITQMLADIEDTEFCGRPMIVGGSNLFRNFVRLKSNGIIHNQAGVIDAASLDFDFYYDKKMRTLWNTEEIGVFDPGAVDLIEFNANVGNFAGMRGTSFFGQLFDPRVQCRTGQTYRDFALDFQLKYIDCPTSLTNYYTGQSQTFQRGWAMYVSKQYDLFTMPGDAYDGADVNHGANGTLHFTIANS